MNYQRQEKDTRNSKFENYKVEIQNRLRSFWVSRYSTLNYSPFLEWFLIYRFV